jgi:hypothetical protein
MFHISNLPVQVSAASAVYVQSSAARMLRPTRSLVTGRVELVGSFEQVRDPSWCACACCDTHTRAHRTRAQVYLDIAVDAHTVRRGATSHVELAPDVMLRWVCVVCVLFV